MLAPGTVLAGRYRIVEPLGHGGMGEVFRAEDLSLRQAVALKLLPDRLAHDPRALERIREEVRMARRVSHSNVCRVHDLGEAGALLFISMEYVDGEDLSTLLRRVGRLAGDRALEIARELCAGLAAAHASGVIHQDLKPANVMLDRRGRVKITDFGLARLGDDGANSSEIAGTPAYMAPEQLAGAGASTRSDLYALGLVLYELFTGRRVFRSESLPELMRAHREGVIVPPRALVPELDVAVEQAILRCLAPRSKDRPVSALAVLTELSAGDPLKAALAAGQTPSPSAVAGATVKGALSPAWAWMCVLAVLSSLAVSFGLASRITILGRLRPPLPPAVLTVKSGEAIRRLGHSGPCVDEASGFDYDRGAVRVAAGRTGPEAERTAAERRMVVFWYRCSAVPLLPLGVGAKVTRDDPAPGPGEAFALLDVDGRLLQYRSRTADGEPGARGVEVLLAFAPLADLRAPPDVKVEGDLARAVVRIDGTVPAGLEARAGAGVVEARVAFPWTAPPGSRAVPFFQPSDAFGLFMVTILAVSVPLGWRNVRSARVDREGAFRVGMVVFGCELVSLALGAHHPGILQGELAALLRNAAWSLFHGTSAALVYVALEPFVRRASPERLVSWSRLLTGNVRDPLVARDVLVGIALFGAMLGPLSLALSFMRPMPLLSATVNLDPLADLGSMAGTALWAIAFTVRTGLCLFLLLLLTFRASASSRWLGPVLFFCAGFLITVANVRAMGGSLPFAAVAGALTAAVWVFLITRFGLLAMTANLLARALSIVAAGATRLTGWTAPNSWCFAVIMVLLAAYGLTFATGRRPFGERKLLEL
jgi:serine/threonine-protein kinase